VEGATVELYVPPAEQRALWRVAMLVARAAPLEQVLAAACEEAAALLGAAASAYRFDSDDEPVTVAGCGAGGTPRVEELDDDVSRVLALVRRRQAVVEPAAGPGERTLAGAPIFADDRVWGALVAWGEPARPLAQHAKRGLTELAELASQSLANERSERLLREERDFADAVVDLSPTLICVFDREGRIVRFNRACEEATGWRADEVVGRDARGLIIQHEEVELFDRILDEAFTARQPHPVRGPWLTRDGGRLTIDFTNRALEDADGAVRYFVSAGLDVTERERATAEIVRLASEQAALRRVATLVARSAEPELVFEAVAEEAGKLLGAESAGTIRFDDGMATTVGRWSAGEVRAFPTGAAVPLSDSDGLTAVVARTGKPARIDDYSGVRGEAATVMREAGYRSGVGAPIVVGGRPWGMVLVASTRAEPLGADAERRLGDFAELVALALEGAQARTDLLDSRARIVSAGDAERRRLERNLHDGAQQRLVSLSLQLRLAQARLRSDPEAAELLAGAADELHLALEELRELARGLHPAVLTDRGLLPALEALASRAPFPVAIAGVPDERLPDSVEAAVYYVVSEALTNAAKHASASRATVSLDSTDGAVAVEIADDGVGGATLGGGSGLRGLADRIEALGGRLTLTSPPGGGTRVRAELPLRPGAR